MEEPQSISEVQKLTRRIAALSKFIPRSADRSIPFFKVLRSPSKFTWGEEQSKAFHDLKEYLENMTKMTSPDPKDPLLLYVSASPSAISTVIVVERLIEGHLKQLPVYFVSEALSNSKLYYFELEKIAYAVVMASRKLRHYFEGHRTIVVTS
jgi:hypothetical protein